MNCPECNSQNIVTVQELNTFPYYECGGCGKTFKEEVVQKNEVQETQEERGKVYGKFEDHANAVDKIMDILEDLNIKKNDSLEANYPNGFRTALFYMVSKIVRLATTPKHEDSALDLGSYADLWLKIIQKDPK